MDKRTAAKGFAWNMGFALVAKLVFPIFGILIARKVGSEAMGVFAVVQTLFAFIELLREAGLGASYIADPNLDPEKERRYAGVAIASGAVFGLALFLSRDILAAFNNSQLIAPALALASVCTFFSGLITVPANRLQREARFRDVGLADLIATTASYGVALVLALKGFGFASLVTQMGVRVILYSLVILKFTPFARPSFGRQGWQILRASVANLASNLAYFVYTTFDYLLVNKVLGAKLNGAYLVAFTIASKPVEMVTAPLTRTVFVAYARAAGDRERQSDLWIRTTSFLALVTLPIYGVLGFHANTIVSLLYGEDFSAAGPALGLLAVYLGFRAFGLAAGSALVGTGHARLNAFSWIPGYAIAIAGIASIWRQPTLMGIVGSLTAGVVAVYATNLAFAFWRLPPTKEQRGRFIIRVSAGLGSAALAGLFRFLPIPAWGQLILALGVGGVIHVAIMGQVLVGDAKAFFSRKRWGDLYRSL